MRESKRALLRQREKLIARIEGQQQLIAVFKAEIYDNVNQVLCLARINLANLEFNDCKQAEKMIEQSGNLISRAIADLRNLAKQVNTPPTTS
jgi:hypothetical protein